MKYRKMGSLDWEVSALGLGCMRLPPRRLNRMRADTEESVQHHSPWHRPGHQLLDTAWPYHLGDSERVVGQALQDGYRERVHLVTKLPMFMVRKTEDFDRFLNTQLDKLQTDYSGHLSLPRPECGRALRR